MHRDSTRRLIRLLLTDEQSAIKWHSRPVPDAVRARLSLPQNAAPIAALATAAWPPASTVRAEAGNTAVSALVLTSDHMINWAVDTLLPGMWPEEPKMEGGVLTWWVTPNRRAYWWLIPLAVVVPVVAVAGDIIATDLAAVA